MPDLVNLFNPGPGLPPFAQGQLVTFNPLTGQNTVNVNGSVYTNLPLLNVPDVVNMVAGSVVMLAQLGGSYAIMGRVVVPSSSQLNSSVILPIAAGGSHNNFAITTGATNVQTNTITAPAWANFVSFIAVGAGCVESGTSTFYQAEITWALSSPVTTANGANVTQTTTGAGQNTCFACSASASRVAITPGATLTVNVSMLAGAGIAANAVSNVELDVLAFFQAT